MTTYTIRQIDTDSWAIGDHLTWLPGTREFQRTHYTPGASDTCAIDREYGLQILAGIYANLDVRLSDISPASSDWRARREAACALAQFERKLTSVPGLEHIITYLPIAQAIDALRDRIVRVSA